MSAQLLVVLPSESPLVCPRFRFLLALETFPHLFSIADETMLTLMQSDRIQAGGQLWSQRVIKDQMVGAAAGCLAAGEALFETEGTSSVCF